MKSMISMAAVLFAALMATTVLTSCGSSDDEPAKAKFTKAVVKYTVTSNDATLGQFKVNVYGTDADGNGFIETMSNTSYTKVVEIPLSKLPCKVELYTRVSPLEDKITTEMFNFKVERTIDVMTLNSDNTVVEDKERTNPSFEDNVPAGTSLSELARSMNYHTKLVISIDVNGIITDQTQESLLEQRIKTN